MKTLKQYGKILLYGFLVAVAGALIAYAFAAPMEARLRQTTVKSIGRLHMINDALAKQSSEVCANLIAEKALEAEKAAHEMHGAALIETGAIIQQLELDCDGYIKQLLADKNAVTKLQAQLDKYGSPVDAELYYANCSQYDQDMCKLFAAIMFSESKYCTHYAKPDVEPDYHNCVGLKSKEIILNGADANGSWLRKFDSFEEFYRKGLEMFALNYWNEGLTTPETVVRRWVGRESESWVGRVYQSLNEL